MKTQFEQNMVITQAILRETDKQTKRSKQTETNEERLYNFMYIKNILR